ncbi:MAG: carbamoyl phosphate synthase small subunit [Bacillota bacterium]|nr:carbamoyl phosphate synthase small subunit [Bacillota bacterium]
MSSERKPRYLVLSSGQVFRGRAAGSRAQVRGEIVFTTAMGGYLEALSDPGLAGQILVFSFPEIGSYGLIPEDLESEQARLAGCVVRSLCDTPSNMRSAGPLEDWLIAQGIPVITDIDTRALIRVLRRNNALEAALCDFDPTNHSWEELTNMIQPAPVKPPQAPAAARHTAGPWRQTAADFAQNPPSWIATLPAPLWTPERTAAERLTHVVLLDYGSKHSLAIEFLRRGVDVSSLPAAATFAQIQETKPDGIIVSGGPGDPADYDLTILKQLIAAGYPLFGVDLGHLLIARAMGLETGRMRFGHRGQNHPVRDTASGLVYITSQGHQHVVRADSISSDIARLEQIHSGDGSCEALRYRHVPILTLAYHPEGGAGPRDANGQIDRFFNLMLAHTREARHAS